MTTRRFSLRPATASWLVFAAWATPLPAAEADFPGEWWLVLQQGRSTMDGVLTIRQTAQGIAGHVEGGPIRLQIVDKQITMAIDDRTATGMPFERFLEGELDAGTMSGTFGPEFPVAEKVQELCRIRPLACPAPTGTWRATPYVASDTAGQPPSPVDLSGRWVLAGTGIRRWTMDLTDAAREWQAGFDVEMDLPSQRCQSPGLVLAFAFRGNDPEIFQSPDRVTMLMGQEIRRIYLDGRKPPDYADWFPLGFSAGRWEGSVLVVETTGLMPSVREWNGEPISENARVVERYSIDEDGLLHGVLTVHDREYYNEPPVRRARWRKSSDDTVHFPNLCDPDAFYRQLYEEDRFDDYIRRADRRY